MGEGWVFDLNPHDDLMEVWLKKDGRTEKYDELFRPHLYARGAIGELEKFLDGDPRVEAMWREVRALGLGGEKDEVVGIEASGQKALKSLAKEIDGMGDFSEYDLFNVDLSMSLRYSLARNISPMTSIGEDLLGVDYGVPPLKAVVLGVDPKTNKIPSVEDPISEIRIGDLTIQGSEEEMLSSLIDVLQDLDPDIIYTDGGDSFAMPYLHHRARENGMDLCLGREPAPPPGKGRSCFSYGRVIYRPPGFKLRGRAHIDRSLFMFRECGLSGLIELSRLSGIPLQDVSRVTPGTVISTIEVAQALKDGVLIPWKKNLPEDFKTAETLFRADRGGMIYEPRTGIHENVVELDFSSLYPHIMVKHNISPETVLCRCCPDRRVVPTIGYNICGRREGLIPRVLRPLIERRMEYKRRLKSAPREKEYELRAKALKWVLVTCFGYAGYRNARFGRIECHEAINAYGRELLLRAASLAESRGYRVLHGIVDSLWLKGGRLEGDHEDLRLEIEEEIGIPLELEGVYRWLVFLPRRRSEVGALNRYYGLFDDGRMKVRGIELRRSDVPNIIKMAQREMLGELAKAGDSEEFSNRIPDAIAVLSDYRDRLWRGDCDPEDLVFTSKVSKPLAAYSQLNCNVASMLQLYDQGLQIRPGESVQYIITDSKSGDYRRKVREWRLMERGNYDREKYVAHLLRAGESLLLPFGYSREKLEDMTSPLRQTVLA
jgi:DNA polymerase elongation subunit (family B)